MSIKNTIIELDEMISNNSKIEYVVEKSEMDVFDFPDSMLQIDKNLIEESNNIVIEPKYMDYLKIAGCSSCWNYTNADNQFIYGGFSFHGCIEALMQESRFWKIYNPINGQKLDDKELKFLEKLNWFEKQAWGDDGKYSCFLREKEEFPPKLYFYDSGAYFPMTISFEEYFDAMKASCAVRGWQYFYIDIPETFPDFEEVNKNVVLADLEFILEMLPKLFPDKDFSYHTGRMDYIRKRLER